MRTPRGRPRALFLAALFVAGSFGLSATDALLDHGLDAPHRIPQVHVEQRGGCHDPVEHCVLGRLLGELRLHSPATATIRVPFADTVATLLVHVSRLAPSLPSTLHRSRAPPSPFA